MAGIYHIAYYNYYKLNLCKFQVYAMKKHGKVGMTC